MPEESGGGDVHGEVERFPKAATEAHAQIRSDHHDGDDIERDGADGVLERLAGGMNGVEEIEGAEFCALVQEKHDRMENGEGKREVAGDVVQAEIVDVAMRPLAYGAVAKGHQGAEEHVDCDGAYGGEADVGGKIQNSDVHCRRGVGRRSDAKGNAEGEIHREDEDLLTQS